jgi:hypothetical protein
MNCPRCGRDTLSPGPDAVIHPWDGWIQCLNLDCMDKNIWVSPDGKKFESLASQPPDHK